MSPLLIARFDGDVEELTRSYDRAHALIMSRGGATSFGELRHHCAVGDGALAGFRLPRVPILTILELHAVEPPL